MKHLVIFVKAPEAGRVKTRLAREVGNHVAAQIYRRMAADIIRRLTNDRRWQSWLAVTPDRYSCPGSAGILPALPSIDAGRPKCRLEAGAPRKAGVIPQGSGDLGARMNRVFRVMPPGPVVIVGSDCPRMTPEHIEEAFRALGSHEAVIGPAEDGGYWLIGLKRVAHAPRLFGSVRWSSPHALEDTLGSLPKGWRVAQLQMLRDVDTLEDWQALRKAVTAPSSAA